MRTILLLFLSNLFMTTAWYWHLKFRETNILKVILISWLIAFVAFAIFYLEEPLRWNYLVGFLLIVLAVFFIFKKW